MLQGQTKCGAQKAWYTVWYIGHAPGPPVGRRRISNLRELKCLRTSLLERFAWVLIRSGRRASKARNRTRNATRYLLHLVSGSSQAEQVHVDWERYLHEEWRPTRSMYGKEPPARVQTIEKPHLRALLDQEISGLSPDLGFDYLLTAARELGMAAEPDEATLSRIAEAARDLTLRPIATREEPFALWM